jgi:hypothetical protein
MSTELTQQRRALLREIERLAKRAIFGTPSETYRTCGRPKCRCHGPGPKHGPHLYMSYRGEHGKTTGYYVPKAAEENIREGIEAWKQLQQELRTLAEQNKDSILRKARASCSKQ